MVGGYGFGGKTMAMQQAAMATAAGVPWWGVYTCKQGPAVYFDREQGERLTRRRFQRLAVGHGIDLASLGDQLRLASMPDLRLTDPSAEAVLCQSLAGVSMAVFDSLRAFCPGADENDSRARDPLDMLGRVSAATGCAIFVVHHARKRKEGDPSGGKYVLRGSSALFDGCDSVLVFAAEKGEPTYVGQEKARSHGECAEDFCLSISDVGGRDGLTVRALGKEALLAGREAKKAEAQRAADATLRPRIADAIRRSAAEGKPVTNQGDLAATLGVNAKRVGDTLRAMLEDGTLLKSGRKGPYTLVGFQGSEGFPRVPENRTQPPSEGFQGSPPLRGEPITLASSGPVGIEGEP